MAVRTFHPSHSIFESLRYRTQDYCSYSPSTNRDSKWKKADRKKSHKLFTCDPWKTYDISKWKQWCHYALKLHLMLTRYFKAITACVCVCVFNIFRYLEKKRGKTEINRGKKQNIHDEWWKQEMTTSVLTRYEMWLFMILSALKGPLMHLCMNDSTSMCLFVQTVVKKLQRRWRSFWCMGHPQSFCRAHQSQVLQWLTDQDLLKWAGM